uniref:Uncharacterized protein n=1 Tax=Quercus lobata TaxID=97700 RepID=A0A7N2N2M3_QUELO
MRGLEALWTFCSSTQLRDSSSIEWYVQWANILKWSKKALAVWLMLEEIGYHDLIRMIHSFDNNTIEALFDEGLQCLECIQPNAIEPSESEDIQVFVGLLDEPMNRRFFYYNREFMHKSYMHVMETVCDKIFGETSAIEVDESGMRPVVRPLGEGTSSHGAALGIFWTHNEPGEVLAHASDEVPMQSNLNPDASEFYPGQTPEETRTMFLTFSSGYLLSREEIVNFFTSNWGPVVKEVVIERIRPGQDPTSPHDKASTPMSQPHMTTLHM